MDKSMHGGSSSDVVQCSQRCRIDLTLGLLDEYRGAQVRCIGSFLTNMFVSTWISELSRSFRH
jgi:hypothetical protein